ncbi:AAA family ATPase [Mycolicibacterium elephantis]|uniref:AAA family ATPase n=1 Tax=Mycolicibacterium elephantis TaxID=81858 RepID=UPI000AAA4521|nr:AAA family ATPase [Mycolicibacterium elephantis]
MPNSTAYERLVDALRDYGSAITENGHGKAQAQCPAHDDGRASLSVTAIDGSVLVYCHAGCQTPDVLAAVRLELCDLFDDRRESVYEYPDGRRVHRTPDKRFFQKGETQGTALYRADRIGTAETVYVCEGEKDVLAVKSVGGAAVCPAMGAGKAHKFDWSPLRGKRVIVVADRDEAGRKHAAQVAELLDGIAASVAVVEAATGKDAADHIAAGKTLEQLVSLTDGMPRLWRATDLRPAAQARWLAKGRLPLASISLLVGDEGIGKSLLWVWIVAAVTTGKPLPEFGIPERDPQHVILVFTEDDWSPTVRPRLEVAGADLTRIQVICTEDDGSGAPTFPRDLHLIEQADPPPALVVVDAWLDTVPPGLSVRDPQQARQALHPWRELATATDAAVLLLCHTNRVASANARDRYGATGELRKKARMTLYAQIDDDGRLVVGPEKMNTAAPIPASAFTITAVQHFPATEDGDGTVPLLTYAGESERTAREHIADAYDTDHGTDSQDRADAERWLRDYLAQEGPRARSADAKREAAKAGISDKMLRRARNRLGVTISYEGMPATSVWSLPEQTRDDAPNGRAQPSVSEGTTDTTGDRASIHAGHARYAQLCPHDPKGHNRANQVPPAQTLPDSTVVPTDTELRPPRAQQAAPGGLTPSTPGQTERVQQTLAKVRNGDRSPLCPECSRAPARSDTGRCDLCTTKARHGNLDNGGAS